MFAGISWGQIEEVISEAECSNIMERLKVEPLLIHIKSQVRWFRHLEYWKGAS